MDANLVNHNFFHNILSGLLVNIVTVTRFKVINLQVSVNNDKNKSYFLIYRLQTFLAKH